MKGHMQHAEVQQVQIPSSVLPRLFEPRVRMRPGESTARSQKMQFHETPLLPARSGCQMFIIFLRFFVS